MVDVLPVPEWLEDAVCEAKHEQVLHRLLAEIMIDAIDLVFPKELVQRSVELTGRLEIASEGLLDDHTAKARSRILVESGGVQPFRQEKHRRGRHAEVDHAVARGAASAIGLVEGTPHGIEAVARIEVVRHVAQTLGKRRPDVIVDRKTSESLDVVAHRVAERLVGHVGAARSDDGETRRQRALCSERVESRHELAPCQIATCAEDDDAARSRDPR